MPAVDAGLILLAAMGAGAVNAVVGAGSLITFPTLLALGVPPVTANVSNTVGLVPGGASAVFAFRSTLVGRGRLLRRLLAMSLTGGVLGAVLLLWLPPDAFAMVVPPLLVFSGVLAALQPRIARLVARRRAATASAAVGANGPDVPDAPGGVDAPGTTTRATTRTSPLLLAGVGAAGVYGGYFGAAQGVILLALLGIFVAGDLTEVNGIKNALATGANLISAGIFIAIADVDWWIVAVIAVGSSIGAALGGRYGRRLKPGVLRVAVVAIAFIAAAWQLLG